MTNRYDPDSVMNRTERMPQGNCSTCEGRIGGSLFTRHSCSRTGSGGRSPGRNARSLHRHRQRPTQSAHRQCGTYHPLSPPYNPLNLPEQPSYSPKPQVLQPPAGPEEAIQRVGRGNELWDGAQQQPPPRAAPRQNELWQGGGSGTLRGAFGAVHPTVQPKSGDVVGWGLW